MSKLLYEPTHSLIHQSFQAQELEEPLNGDGFGTGWYAPDIDPYPAVFVSSTPAWSNRNLRYLAEKIRSHCLVAHVRAASTGEVSESNCHPFHYQELLMLHNGDVGNFPRIKRAIRRKLCDEIYDWIKGQTDSEHLFALFLHYVGDTNGLTPTRVRAALQSTISDIAEMKTRLNIKDAAYLNLVVTNGKFMIAARYVSDPEEKPATLYFLESAGLECENGICKIRPAGRDEKAILIVSEKLAEIEHEWHEVPANHFVTIDEDLRVELHPIR
ncbi:MAG: class II glutamine amidotransferase [Candidatus Omnitrophota bacterium]|nr:class II glutamine amidotransferase [Candidatus Omnitrophota bacterium]